MNDSRSYITLDFRNTHMPVVVKAKRGDTARTLYISLADGGRPYLIADGCFATFTAKKPDRTVINNSCTIEKNMIVYPFTDQTCNKDGRITAEIRLYGSNGRMLTSASFILEVHKTVFGPNDIPASESEMNALDALILETTALKEEVEKKLENGDFIGEPGPPGPIGPVGPEGPQGPAGSGITKEAASLLISILREALFTSDQSKNIQKLALLLLPLTPVDPDPGYSGPGEPDVPDEPDEPEIPDDPVISKLEAPVIRLETVGEPEEPSEPDEPDEPKNTGNNSAILGVAVVGQTILGSNGVALPKLSSPIIYLLGDGEEIPKLNTPVIRLETTDNPVVPNEPDNPVIPKLEAPVIELETTTEPGTDEPVTHNEPDEPEIQKLTAPEIYLEIEPEEPVIVKLVKPEIELVEV